VTIPNSAWGPLLGIVFGVVAMLEATWFKPATQVVFNPTDSAPRGWYLVTPATHFRVGDYVVTRIPENAALLAATRGYLPMSVSLLKRVRAVGGTRVCGCDGAVYVADEPVVRALDVDRLGRPLTGWQECRVLASDELFLLHPGNIASFDSRYFGPVKTTDVRGRATPLWTWTQR
jgi:conjugative transfer signal peptidase TraF